MKFKTLDISNQTFQAILSGGYTPLDLREFVQLCHDLALPIIRKKIVQGKINRASLRLSEKDIVYDCLADLFHRDEDGNFDLLRKYFDQQLPRWETTTVDEILVTLRHLIFGKINNGIVRLYTEADPTLGKILRNMKKALEKSLMFEQFRRFGDIYLIPVGVDAQYHLVPMPFEVLQNKIAQTVLIHDTIPTMIQKLYNIIVNQQSYQRAVPLVSVGIIFKEIYQLGAEDMIETNTVEEQIDIDLLGRVIDDICKDLCKEMHHTYVDKGTCSQEAFGKYIETAKSILKNSLLDDHLDGSTYFEHLQVRMPQLTKEEYRANHRSILEYITKVGKERLRDELRNETSHDQ